MFEGIDHVAFLVAEMAEGRRQFEDVYGVDCAGTNSPEHRRANGADAAFFPVGDVVVELLSPIADADPAESWPAAHMAEHGEGFFHVAYAVSDLESAVDRLDDRDVRFLNEEPVAGFSGPLVTLDPRDTVVPTQVVEPDGSGP